MGHFVEDISALNHSLGRYIKMQIISSQLRVVFSSPKPNSPDFMKLNLPIL